MTTTALAIFTGKATPEVLRVGGTRSWVLDQRKARSYKYAVLYFNDHAPWSTKGYTQHRAAFLVGRISDVVVSKEYPNRYIVEFDQYAEIADMGEWGGWRNPIRYSTLEDLGIDEGKLNFKPMPPVEDDISDEVETPSIASARVSAPSEPARLTIESAKAGLAATYGIKPEAIEIIIRG